MKQDRASDELISKLPEYLFETHRKDPSFYDLVRRSAETCDNYTQLLEKIAEHYVELKQAEDERAMRISLDKRLAKLNRRQYIEYMLGASEDFQDGYIYGKQSILGFFIWVVLSSAMIGFSLGCILL